MLMAPLVPGRGLGGMFVVTVVDECYIEATDTAHIVVEDCNPLLRTSLHLTVMALTIIL